MELDKIKIVDGNVIIPIDVIEEWSSLLDCVEYDSNVQITLNTTLNRIINEHYKTTNIIEKVETVDNDFIEYDNEPYCSECGGDKLIYLEQYANGEQYTCKECGYTFMWDNNNS